LQNIVQNGVWTKGYQASGDSEWIARAIEWIAGGLDFER
jgi:hypothetical protein